MAMQPAAVAADTAVTADTASAADAVPTAGVLDFNAQCFADTPRAVTKMSRLWPESPDVLAFDAQSSPTRCRP